MSWKPLLVEKKGYAKSDLEPRLRIETLYNGQYVASTIDITVREDDKRFMILRFAPGSIVTRERAAIAAARVLEPSYRIPLVVVTNCKDAEVLDSYTGKVIRQGLDSIPDRKEAESLVRTLRFEPFDDEEKRDRNERKQPAAQGSDPKDLARIQANLSAARKPMVS